MHIDMNVCIYAYVCRPTCIYECALIHTCTYMQNTCVCIHAYMKAGMHVHKFLYIHINIHITCISSYG